jgi:hypothetical protein
MVDTFPLKYELTIRPCTIHPARYRWVITGNGKPVQTSMNSFETSAMAPCGWEFHARKTDKVVDDWTTRTATSPKKYLTAMIDVCYWPKADIPIVARLIC